MTGPGIWADGHWRSLEQLKDRSRHLAGVLAERGVRDGAPVGLLIGNRPEFIEAVLAARRLGVTTIPMSTQLTAAELGRIITDAGVRMLLADPDLAARAGQAGAEVIEAAGESYETLLEGTTPWTGRAATSPEPMPYTSGTTGTPKGVHKQPPNAGQAAAAADWTDRLFAVEPGARTVIATPLYHSAGYGYAMLVLGRGGSIVLEQRFDAERLLQLIDEHRITNLQLVPTMMYRLVRLSEATRARYDVSSLRHVLHGAGPCPPDVKRALIDWWGPIVHEYYGSTETGALVACDSHEWLTHPGTVGRAQDGAQVRILDDDRHALRAGEVGTVYGRHPAMTEFTYHRDQAKRAAAQHGDLVTAGDLGFLDEDGYLYIVSRRSDLIVCGGVNVYPAEIEQQLLAMPGVRDCVVVGIDDEERGQVLAAVLELEPGAASDGDDVRAFLVERLARVKVPRRVDIVSALPRDGTGKVRRSQLSEYLARTP